MATETPATTPDRAGEACLICTQQAIDGLHGALLRLRARGLVRDVPLGRAHAVRHLAAAVPLHMLRGGAAGADAAAIVATVRLRVQPLLLVVQRPRLHRDSNQLCPTPAGELARLSAIPSYQRSSNAVGIADLFPLPVGRFAKRMLQYPSSNV